MFLYFAVNQEKNVGKFPEKLVDSNSLTTEKTGNC